MHQVDQIQIICSSLPTDNQPSILLLDFYKPDALPYAQQTMSKNHKICALYFSMYHYVRVIIYEQFIGIACQQVDCVQDSLSTSCPIIINCILA